MSENLPESTGSNFTDADLDSVIEGVRSVVEIVGQESISRLKLDYGPLQVEVEYAPERPAAPLSQPPTEPEVQQPAQDRLLDHIDAPLVGVFYQAPGPGKPPFVEPGQQVAAGEQVGIIEAMKMMNSVLAECSGTVVEVLVVDGDIVEFEQHLIAIAPR